MITFKGEIKTDVEEQRVFEAFKEFMNDNFQNFNFELSGDKETFKHEWKPTEIKEEEKDNSTQKKI